LKKGVRGIYKSYNHNNSPFQKGDKGGLKMSIAYQDWIELYTKWLENSICVEYLKNRISYITTPFLDRHNDLIAVYVQPTDNGFLISDEDAIPDLQTCTIYAETSKKLNGILLNHGLTLDNEILTKHTTVETFGKDFHYFIQALIEIYTLS